MRCVCCVVDPPSFTVFFDSRANALESLEVAEAVRLSDSSLSSRRVISGVREWCGGGGGGGGGGDLFILE